MNLRVFAVGVVGGSLVSAVLSLQLYFNVTSRYHGDQHAFGDAVRYSSFAASLLILLIIGWLSAKWGSPSVTSTRFGASIWVALIAGCIVQSTMFSPALCTIVLEPHWQADVDLNDAETFADLLRRAARLAGALANSFWLVLGVATVTVLLGALIARPSAGEVSDGWLISEGNGIAVLLGFGVGTPCALANPAWAWFLRSALSTSVIISCIVLVAGWRVVLFHGKGTTRSDQLGMRMLLAILYAFPLLLVWSVFDTPPFKASSAYSQILWTVLAIITAFATWRFVRCPAQERRTNSYWFTVRHGLVGMLFAAVIVVTWAFTFVPILIAISVADSGGSTREQLPPIFLSHWTWYPLSVLGLGTLLGAVQMTLVAITKLLERRLDVEA